MSTINTPINAPNAEALMAAKKAAEEEAARLAQEAEQKQKAQEQAKLDAEAKAAAAAKAGVPVSKTVKSRIPAEWDIQAHGDGIQAVYRDLVYTGSTKGFTKYLAE